MKKQIRVVWICHFSNVEVRNKLPLSNFYLLNVIKKLLGNNKITYSDFAPWINILIKEFEKLKDVELHIIAPHKGLRKFNFEFEMNGVYYYFYKTELFFVLSKIRDIIIQKRQRKYKLNRFFVKRFIKKIEPDLVNLFGTENPYYSITILDIKDIPILVTSQTVYANPNRKKLSGEINYSRWNIEVDIHSKEQYFGCSGRMHRDLIIRNNSNATILKNYFPLQRPIDVKNVTKEYDFVFFAANITPKKGIEDALSALAFVKKKNNTIKLNIVGKCLPDYKAFLKSRIFDLDLTENTIFHDYFPVHTDLLQHLKKSRFALLPVKLDAIPGTIVEAMLLELPVITYKTTGTPYLNKNGETVLIANIGDIEKLAENMLRLLNLPALVAKLKKDAKAFVEKEFGNTTIAKRYVDNYRAVYNHYYHNKPIPEELLFNPEEFPLY